jgi:DNA-binding transcriptional MerR regulator
VNNSYYSGIRPYLLCEEDIWMKYSIGEFANILGVTADTLRLYEKYDIIKPIKDRSNNYRYFNDLDARNLLMSRWYRSMRIPLQEVALLMKASSLEDVISKVEETQRELEEEIRTSTLLLEKLTEIKGSLEETGGGLNSCRLKDIPGIFRLKQTNRNLLLKDDYPKETVSAWMNLLPYAFFSFRIAKEEMWLKEYCFEYNWGLAIFEHEAGEFDVKSNEDIEYLAPQVCISAIIDSSDEEYMTRDSIQFMLDYISANHYSIQGDIIGKIIFTEKSRGKNKTYLEVNIPVAAQD